MIPLILAALVTVLTPLVADAEWRVDYINSSNGLGGGFYGDGSYIFVCCESGQIVVGIHDGFWKRLPGYYVTANLPADIPKISFEGTPYDEAVAVNIGSGGGGGGGAVGAPELAILRRLTPKHLGGPQLAAALNPRLQPMTAWGAALVLRAVGLPAVWRGNFIDLPSVTLEVIPWCSGITLMKWLTLLACMIALVWRSTLPWKVAIVLAAPLIAFEANTLRVAATGVAFDVFHADWSVKEWLAWGALILGMAQVVGLGLVASWNHAQAPQAGR
jgi:exosortase/archaeosortase family protein